MLNMGTGLLGLLVSGLLISSSSSFKTASLITLMVLAAWLKLVKISNNLMLTLLTLELIMLTNYLLMTSTMYLEGATSSLFLTYFTFAVAEASLGLSILIFLVRNKGSEFISL